MFRSFHVQNAQSHPVQPQGVSSAALLRLLLSVLALVLVAAHVSATLHFALIAHTICPDHGHWVEGSESAQQEQRGHSQQSGSASVTHSDGELAHDHCEFSALPRQELAILQASGAEVRTPSADVAPMAHPDVVLERFGISILLLAPKLSPPT